MLRILTFTLLSLLLSAGMVAAQDRVQSTIWQRSLTDTGDLIERIEDLVEYIQAGDADGVSSQFRPEKVRLFSRTEAIPADLYAHSQARSILHDFFRRTSPLELRISLVRMNSRRDCASVALDILGDQTSGIRPLRERIIVIYQRAESSWEIKEMGCH
ncbi:MAG: hypothetical protein GY835_14090 [bacterium]|nr:hypothetical protein [bacterium]